MEYLLLLQKRDDGICRQNLEKGVSQSWFSSAKAASYEPASFSFGVTVVLPVQVGVTTATPHKLTWKDEQHLEVILSSVRHDVHLQIASVLPFPAILRGEGVPSTTKCGTGLPLGRGVSGAPVPLPGHHHTPACCTSGSQMILFSRHEKETVATMF